MAAEGILSLRKLEDSFEGVVDVFETAQAVAEVRGCLLMESGSRGPGGEVVDLVLDLGSQRVRSAGKTDGSGVMRDGWFLRWTVRILVWETKGASENTNHNWFS